MKPKQTRYVTEQEILHDIDREKERARNYNIEAERFEKQAQEAVKKAAVIEGKAGALSEKEQHEVNSLIRDFQRLKARARGRRKQAKSIEEVRLPNLSRTLAAFNTVPMIEICGLDKGVVYQNQ